MFSHVRASCRNPLRIARDLAWVGVRANSKYATHPIIAGLDAGFIPAF